MCKQNATAFAAVAGTLQKHLKAHGPVSRNALQICPELPYIIHTLNPLRTLHTGKSLLFTHSHRGPVSVWVPKQYTDDVASWHDQGYAVMHSYATVVHVIFPGTTYPPPHQACKHYVCLL